MISPESSDGYYNLGDTVTVNCSYDPEQASSENVTADLMIEDDLVSWGYSEWLEKRKGHFRWRVMPMKRA